MASRADQVAANLSLAKFGEATELRKRIWFTLGALVIFRLLSFVPAAFSIFSIHFPAVRWSG